MPARRPPPNPRHITAPKSGQANNRWNSIQSWLFPVLEDELGALDEKHRQFVAVCELLE